MTPAEKKQRIYSPSQLKLYDSCPGAWAAQYLHKEESTDESYPLDYGSLYHEIIAHYNHHCVKKGVPADPDVMPDIVNKHFWENGRSSLIPDGDWQGMMDLCMRTAHRQVLDLDHLVDIESFYWMDVNGYRFRGKPDLVFVDGNRATVPDYKTSRVAWTDKQVAADFKSQCYAALVMAEENCPQVDAVKIVMGFERWGVTPSATFTFDHAERVKEEIYWRIQRLEADMAYECTPGDWCGLCRYRSTCPALTHAMMGAKNMVKVVADYEQAQFLVGEMKLLEVALKNRKDALKVYAKHTPVVANGLCYGPREHRSRTYDADELFKAYDGTESGPFAMLSADGTKIRAERERKRKHEPGVDLEALGTETVRTRMELYTVPKPAPEPEPKEAAGE